MIKILEYGQRYVVTCPVCNAKLEYGIDDVGTYLKSNAHVDETGHYILRGWNVKGIECPVCTLVIEDGLYEKA